MTEFQKWFAARARNPDRITLEEAYQAGMQAKIEQMEKPVAWLHETRRDSDVVTDAVKHVWGKAAVGSMAAYSIPLYALPGAQPAPSLASGDVSLISEGKTQQAQSVPDGWKLVPIEFLEHVIGLCTHRGSSPESIESWDKEDKWIADLWRQAKEMLAAAPEAKP